MTAEGVGYWVPRQGFGGKYFIANLAMKKTIAILTILVTHLFKVSQLLQVKMPLVSPALLNVSINERISLIIRIRKDATFFWFSWILTIIRSSFEHGIFGCKALRTRKKISEAIMDMKNMYFRCLKQIQFYHYRQKTPPNS